MVTTDTNCATCTHSKVCSLKEKVTEVKNKVLDEYSNVSPIVEIVVRCTEYRKGDMFPSFRR